MSPRHRRLLQALLYETIAIAALTPGLAWLFDRPAHHTASLSLFMSAVALSWNYLFNTQFERWEARQPQKGRSPARRLAHTLGFEGGLILLLVPPMAWWLSLSLWTAFVANLGVVAFFLAYSFCFTWTFDHLFGLPASARISQDA